MNGECKVSKGKTPWVWVHYEDVINSEKRSLQVVEWPNGEGYTVIRNDETTIDITHDEWGALNKAMRELQKATNE